MAETPLESVEALIQIEDGSWLSFRNPVRVIETRDVENVPAALDAVTALTAGGSLHAAGFVAYEAGAAFGLSVCPGSDDLPLVWFALFEDRDVQPVASPTASAGYELGPLAPSVDRTSFDAAFAEIKAHLSAGDTYQVNYTFRIAGTFLGDARSLFADLAVAQQGRHSAYLRLGSHAICSASPELFFSRAGHCVSARPMKGTVRRGRTLDEDRLQRDRLHQSPKQRAENVMVVDMVRNDLGRIADVGSVAVPELFATERYPNVWQMTSLVTARSSAPLAEVFAALHPSASVTGAPKVRTMQILSRLERRRRGVYTGAVGHVWPGGAAAFNVAIRTAVVDHRVGRIEFGVGSGIVWDSEPAEEYEECLLKGSVLGQRRAGFELLETLRWSPPEGFYLLERHLQRLRDSAEYFGFAYRAEEVRSKLADAVAGGDGAWRVRLLVPPDGAARVERAPLQTGSGPLQVCLAAEPIDASDPFLFHKTTNRGVYERARRPGCDDVLLWNRRRQVTEATVANVVVDLGGAIVTPPVECGLLAGTLRAELLAAGAVREAAVTVEELLRAERLWLINSVHGWRPAVIKR